MVLKTFRGRGIAIDFGINTARKKKWAEQSMRKRLYDFPGGRASKKALADEKALVTLIGFEQPNWHRKALPCPDKWLQSPFSTWPHMKIPCQIIKCARRKIQILFLPREHERITKIIRKKKENVMVHQKLVLLYQVIWFWHKF